MKIIVLLKQTPDTGARIIPSADGSTVETGSVKYIVNPYDEVAVEEALNIKSQIQGAEVTVLSFGPPAMKERMLRALTMGADRGLLINNEGAEKADSLSVARVLTAAVRSERASLVLCGKQGIDGDNMHTGVMTAELLNWPHVNAVTKMIVEGNQVRAEREVEGGWSEIYQVQLPAVFGAHNSLNKPRYISLPGIMKAKKKPFAIKNLTDLGLDPASLASGSKTKTEGFRLPDEKPSGKLFRDEPVDVMVDKVIRLLREEAGVL